MSRQSRQANLRKRMAEARSKLSLSVSDEVPLIDAKPSSVIANSILRKPKYSSGNVEGKTEALHSSQSDGNALGGLIGDYSSSEDEGGGAAVSPPAAVASKKRDAPALSEKQHSEKRTKFSADVHVRAITSDEDIDSIQGGEKTNAKGDTNTTGKEQQTGMAKNIAGESISDEVWDEFNALLDDEPDATTAGGDDQIVEQKIASEATQTTDQSGYVANAEAAEKTETAKPKKKKKRKKQIADSYDNEALVNVEQASYEARLARLVLLKSNKAKSESGVANDALKSIDFYDPGLAFQQDDNDDEEEEKYKYLVGNGDGNKTHDDNKHLSFNKAFKTSSSQSTSNASTSNGTSLAEILRKRKKDARQTMSDKVADAKGSKQDDDEGLLDGFWF